jgi:hypothetical protein
MAGAHVCAPAAPAESKRSRKTEFDCDFESATIDASPVILFWRGHEAVSQAARISMIGSEPCSEPIYECHSAAQ